jgi:N-acetylglucosaminyl-diphospho-decaprenol L-rhamnosyltransferase
VTGGIVAVVLNYERPDDTIRCLRSLRLLEDLDGVIVVDNASRDDSVARLEREFPEVELLVAEENRGYTGGNNLGIRRALAHEARFVLVLNNDVEVVDPAFARVLAHRLSSDPRAGIAGPLVRYPDGSLQDSVERYPSFPLALRLALAHHLGHRSGPPAVEREVNAVNGACLLVKREVLDDVDGFDEGYFMYGEEADLAWRARRKGWRSLFVPVPAVVHHHAPDESRGRGALLPKRNFVRFCLLHRGRASAGATALLFLAGAAGRDLRRRHRRELPALREELRAVWEERR